MPQSQPAPQLTTYVSQSGGEPLTMLAEAVMIWDDIDERGMDDEVFMLAYVMVHRTHLPLEMSLIPLGPLMPEAQRAPSGLLREMGALPAEALRAMTPGGDQQGFRVAGLACFRHTWALTGQAMLERASGGYTGQAVDHPDRVRIRLMLGHYAGQTISLARTADKEDPQLYPEEAQGQLVQVLARTAAAFDAATQGG